MSLAWTLDHVVPIARTAADCALVLSVIAGQSAGDLTSSDREPRDYRSELDEGVNGLRIGVIHDWFFERCDSEVVSATNAAIREFDQAGAELVELSFRSAASLAFDAISHTINTAEIASLHAVTLAQLSLYGPEFARLLDVLCHRLSLGVQGRSDGRHDGKPAARYPRDTPPSPTLLTAYQCRFRFVPLTIAALGVCSDRTWS